MPKLRKTPSGTTAYTQTPNHGHTIVGIIDVNFIIVSRWAVYIVSSAGTSDRGEFSAVQSFSARQSLSFPLLDRGS